jgi:NitT/TauT family transport system substrate-binding protein
MCREKRFLRVKASAWLFAVVLLAACGAPSPPKPQFTLRIGLFTTQDYIPYFVMQEQGFAKQHGLLFQETSYPGGAAIIQDIAAGALDMGIAGSVPVLSAAERGIIPGKVVVVAANNFADPDHPGGGLLVAPFVNTWKDLQGQFIAVNAVNSIQDAAIKGRLRQEGVRDYSIVEIPFANMGLAVAGGNVAAATMYEPFLSQSLLRGDGKLLGWIIGGPPFERMESTVIVFSADLYRGNPQAVKAFLRAYLRALKWMHENPEATRAILAKRLDLSKEVGLKVKLAHWPPDARNNPALLDSMQPTLVQLGMLKAPIPAGRLYDETLLNEVLAEKR